MKSSNGQRCFSGFYRIVLGLVLSIVSCLSWADYTMNLHPGVSKISHKIYHLHMTIFWICVVIGVLVFGVLIYSLIMHRKSRGHKAHDFHENTTVEVIWTIIPFIILISMAIPATSVLKFIDDTTNSDVLVKVTGYQWRWQYEYPEHNINFFSNLLTPQEQIDNKDVKDALYLYDVDNYLVLPVGKKIRFLFTSNDVIHSWWVPQLGVKKDTVPGFINESWVMIDKPGIYRGQCAELCGARHGYMPIVVDARTEDDYKKWVNDKKLAAASAPPPPSHHQPNDLTKEEAASLTKPDESSAKSAPLPNIPPTGRIVKPVPAASNKTEIDNLKNKEQSDKTAVPEQKIKKEKDKK